MGIRDAPGQKNAKNDHCVNVVVTPTIILPSASKLTPTTKATKQSTKSPVHSKKKSDLNQARKEAKSRVATNISARLRTLKTKKVKS